MADSKKIDCISPNTGVAFDQWEETGPAEFQSALDKLSSASFSDLSEVTSRRKALFAISNAIEKNRNEFETIIVNEVGKTKAEAVAEVDYSKSFLTYMADLVISESFLQKIDTDRKVHSVSRGLGLLITPFNDPLAGITRKLANCLGAGSGAIVKPPELGIKTASKLEQVINEEHLDHLVSFYRTRDRDLIKSLIETDEIGTISFTGSTEVGRVLSTLAGANLKAFVGELGGINPFIIFSDANIEKAVEDLVIRKTKAAGQACSAQNILFVERGVAHQVIGKITEAFANIEALPTNRFENALMGPVRSQDALDKLLNFEAKLINSDASMVVGAKNKNKTSGYMYNPSAYLVDDPLLFMEYEIFAPLLGIFIFEDRSKIKEIIKQNKQPLVLYAYSEDEIFLEQFIFSLNYGSIGLNDTGIQGAFAPTGGFKNAGLGREGGKWGLNEFTATVNVKSRTA